jgi:hypothetical protein
MAFQSIDVVLSLHFWWSETLCILPFNFVTISWETQNRQDFAMKDSLPDEIAVWSSLMS